MSPKFLSRFFSSVSSTPLATAAGKTVKILCLSVLLCCITLKDYATVWTTATSGAINNLANWTNGVTSPASFTTPGDTWKVTMNMTMPSPGTWTVGTAASILPDTVIIGLDDTISMSGAGSTSTITINGVLENGGGNLTLGGAGTIANVNVFGRFYMLSGIVLSNGASTNLNFTINGNLYVSGGIFDANGASGGLTITTHGNDTITGGTLEANGASSKLTFNTHGNFSMSGGTFLSGGAGGVVRNNAYGNCMFSGTAAMTGSAGDSSTVHFCLPTASGTMLIGNTSTGTWSGTNAYVDTGCTAQLDSNFSTTTGALGFGVTVKGTLICPAAYMMNGTKMFKLNATGTLEVASPAGINGAITTTGTTSFNDTANYVFNGTVAQVTGSYLPTALFSPSMLTIDNAAGVTLSQTTSTTGVLAFISGILTTTSAYTMSTPGIATAVTGAGATSYVDGTLIKTISGLTSVNYEVGDTDYAPMLLTLSAAGTGGSIGLMATHGLHPMVATSGLSSSNMTNHYWTITNSGATGPVNIIPTATYNFADIIGGTNSAFLTQEYRSSVWLGAGLTSTNTSTPYTTAPTTGIALGTIAGDYIFGNLFCGTLPISGSSSVCAGASISLTDATPAGTWASSTTGVATVSAGGVVRATTAGTTTISYNVSGCIVTQLITVDPTPVSGTITGRDSVCIGHTVTLTDTAASGVWSSFSTGTATVASGAVTGVASGIDTIYYTVSNSCGTAITKVAVTVLTPSACTALTESPVNTLTPALQIFPNPNDGSFTLQLTTSSDEAMNVVITNIVGVKVKEWTTVTNKPIDINLNQPTGMYIITASTAQGKYVEQVIAR